jgi:hypothetical protein
MTDSRLIQALFAQLKAHKSIHQPWHRNIYKDQRKIMQSCIMDLIQTANEESITSSSSSPTFSDSTEAIMLDIAKVIESYLYDTAICFTAYFDVNTLIHRIQQLVDRVVTTPTCDKDNHVAEEEESESVVVLPIVPAKAFTAKSSQGQGQGQGQGPSRVFILKG